MDSCPFCGTTDHLESMAPRHPWDGHRIRCGGCTAEGPPGASPAEAATEWSQRASSNLRANLFAALGLGDEASDEQIVAAARALVALFRRIEGTAASATHDCLTKSDLLVAVTDARAQLFRAKGGGEAPRSEVTTETPAAPPAEIIDLMAALKSSLKAAATKRGGAG